MRLVLVESSIAVASILTTDDALISHWVVCYPIEDGHRIL